MKYLYLPLVLILVGCISSNSPTEGDFLKREGNGMYYAHKPMLMEINSVPPPFDIGGNFPYVLWINGKRVPYAPMKELSAVVAKVGEDKIKDIEVIMKDDKQLFVLDNDCLHFDIDKKNNVTDIYRYGGNDETYILAKLSQHFDVAIFSEYDEEYDTLLEMEEESNVIKISIDDLQPAKALN